MCAKLDRQRNGEIVWAYKFLLRAHLLSDVPLLRARLAVLQDGPATQHRTLSEGGPGESIAKKWLP